MHVTIALLCLISVVGCEFVSRTSSTTTWGHDTIKRESSGYNINGDYYNTFIEVNSNLPRGRLVKVQLYKNTTTRESRIRFQLWKHEHGSVYTLKEEIRGTIPKRAGLVTIHPTKEVLVELHYRMGFALETPDIPIFLDNHVVNPMVLLERSKDSSGNVNFPRKGDTVDFDINLYIKFSISAEIENFKYKGSTGERGPRGRDGRDGKEGRQGKKGDEGRKGDRGRDGRNGKDGGKDVNECEEKPKKCDQHCRNTFGSYECYCDDGFEIKNNKCVDINECETQLNGGCDQICKNIYASHECYCKKGFKLSNNMKSCIDIDECTTSSKKNGGCKQICVNTEGSFRCISIGFGGGNMLAAAPAAMVDSQHDEEEPKAGGTLMTFTSACLTLTILSVIAVMAVKYRRSNRTTGPSPSNHHNDDNNLTI